MKKSHGFSAKQLALDHQNFASLYKNFALPLTKFLAKRIGADHEAMEEVFSQTIIAAWKGWRTFEHKSSYFTWICRIALNKMADYYREQVNEKSRLVVPALDILSNIPDKNLSPDERLALDQLREAVKECLNLLPEEKRQLLYLRFWQDLTVAKIAEILGVSERAAEGKLYRAKLAFRKVANNKYPGITSLF